MINKVSPAFSFRNNFSKFILIVVGIFFIFSFGKKEEVSEWIRINQLGYTPQGIKVAVWCSEDDHSLTSFDLIDSATGKKVFTQKTGKAFGSYGPFANTYRLNFSSWKKPGVYFLKAGNAKSPLFRINEDVYKGTADFCLFYLRQQRSGFNPFAICQPSGRPSPEVSAR